MGEDPIRTLIADNWKMHGTQAQLVKNEGVARLTRESTSDVDALVCVPAALIASAVQAAKDQTLCRRADQIERCRQTVQPLFEIWEQGTQENHEAVGAGTLSEEAPCNARTGAGTR